MARASEDQRSDAKMHATVWQNVFNECQRNTNPDIDRNVLRTLATFALIVGGEYRRIANSGKFDD